MATSFENFSSNLKERRGGEESASSSGEQDEFCRYTNIVHYWLIPAVLFTVIVSFLQKRRTKRAIDFKCPLNQRFGLPLPLKLLSLHSNRWAFAMAFGAIANVVVDRIGQETSVCLFNAPSWAKVFVILVSAMEVAVIHYPMFVCLTVENKVLGNLMGFVYTLAWFAFQVYKTVDQQNHKDMYEEALAVPVPALLCCTFLVLNFLRGFLKQLSSGCFRDSQDLTDLPHVTAYVKRLLKPSDAVVKKSLFQRLVYEWDPCFHFPARMIIVLVMALNTIYQTAFVQLSLVINFHEFYRNCTAEGNLFCIFFSGAFPDFDTTLIVTSFLTLFITVYHTFQIMVQYRNQIRKLYKGDRTGLPPKLPHSDVAVARSITYIGIQIAFLISGMAVMNVMLFLVVYSVIVLPIKQGLFRIAIRDIIINAAPVLLVLYLLMVITQWFFLQEKLSPTDKKKPLALNNIRALENISYFCLFFYIVEGAMASAMRLLTSFILGSLSIARIDHPTMSVVSRLDAGYWAWVSVLMVDSTHTNPTVLAFSRILAKCVSTSSHDGVPEGRTEQWRHRARCRWWLGYTLLRNPRLVPLRRQGYDVNILASGELTPVPQSPVTFDSFTNPLL